MDLSSYYANMANPYAAYGGGGAAYGAATYNPYAAYGTPQPAAPAYNPYDAFYAQQAFMPQQAPAMGLPPQAPSAMPMPTMGQPQPGFGPQTPIPEPSQAPNINIKDLFGPMSAPPAENPAEQQPKSKASTAKRAASIILGALGLWKLYDFTLGKLWGKKDSTAGADGFKADEQWKGPDGTPIITGYKSVEDKNAGKKPDVAISQEGIVIPTDQIQAAEHEPAVPADAEQDHQH